SSARYLILSRKIEEILPEHPEHQRIQCWTNSDDSPLSTVSSPLLTPHRLSTNVSGPCVSPLRALPLARRWRAFQGVWDRQNAVWHRWLGPGQLCPLDATRSQLVCFVPFCLNRRF